MQKMLKALSFLCIDLTLFGEDGGEAGAQGDTTGGQSSTLSDDSGDFSNVIFGEGTAEERAQLEAQGTPVAGEEETTEDTETAEPTQEELDEEFQGLIKGKYKNSYGAITDKLMRKRWSGIKQQEDTLKAHQPIMDKLFTKYDLEDGDYEGLSKAIDNDRSYQSQAAEEADMTEEQYDMVQGLKAEKRRLQRENEGFRKWQEDQHRTAHARSVTEKWLSDAKELQKEYPDFDLTKEVGDREFLGLLSNGATIRQAFMYKYGDKAIEQARQSAAKSTEKQVTDNIRAQGMAPTENGVKPGGAFRLRNDPSTWTDAEMAEVKRRVENGEKIILKR